MGTNFELKMALVREGHVRPSRFCRALPSGYRTLNQALPYFGSKNTVPRIKKGRTLDQKIPFQGSSPMGSKGCSIQHFRLGRSPLTRRTILTT
jgi:hypothetical protein